MLSFWVCVARHAQSTQNKKFACLYIYLEKHGGMKLGFCLQINTKVFSKLLVSVWVCMASNAESTQKNKFTTSWQSIRENVKNEVNILPTDKCQRLLQIATIILGVNDQAYPNYPK